MNGKKNYSGAVTNGGERGWGDNQRNNAVPNGSMVADQIADG
jgi:hypothetical protein